MNTENENGKHDLNFFLDKQLQQKLLDADDNFLEKDFASGLISSYIASSKFKPSSTPVINGNNSNITNKQASNIGSSGNSSNSSKVLKYLHSVHVCGWCPNPSIHYRKSESDVPPRSKAGLAVNVNNITRDSLFSRDSKSRPQNLNNFVFKHYADPRKYIEQYRREHACYDTTNSSATKSEFLESRRFYAYNQYSPLAVGCQAASHQSHGYAPQQQPEMHFQSNETQQKSANQTPTLHYSNRREQQRQNISANLRAKNQHQYKLSKNAPPKSEDSLIQDYTEEYIEALEISRKQRNSGSAKERSSSNANSTSVQKQSATKVNIPAGTSVSRNIRQLSSGSPSEATQLGHFHSHKLGQPGNGTRTLDQLSCVVSTPLDRQSQVRGPDKTAPSDKPKSGGALSARQKNNNNNNNNNNNVSSNGNAPSTTASAPTSMPVVQSSKSPKPNSETMSHYSNNSSHNKRERKEREDGPLSNGPCHLHIEHTDSSHIPNGDLNSGNFASEDNDRINHFPSLDNHGVSLLVNDNKMVDLDASSNSSGVSIGCLSTKCLGVEANVKLRPKLEASCTYHVFPNELTLNQHQGLTPSLLWNPSKSALEKRLQTPNGASVEFGLPSPFRHSPRVRPKTEEGRSSRVVEFITKEFVADTKPINLCPDIFKDTPRLATAPGLKTNTIKPDLPATFALQGFSKRPHFEAFSKKKGPNKTALTRKKKENKSEKDGGRKSWSASTDASSHSAPGNNTMKLKPMTVDSGNASANSNTASTTLAPVPYFKFWNSSLPPRSRDSKRMGADKSGDLTMQQLAEMVLTDGSGDHDRELKEAAQKVLEQHAKSEEGHHSTAGIATGDPWVTQTIGRLSQARLLESICLINQRPAEPAPRPSPLHLTFMPEDSSQSQGLAPGQPQLRAHARQTNPTTSTTTSDIGNGNKSRANFNPHSHHLSKTIHHHHHHHHHHPHQQYHNFLSTQNSRVSENECDLEISNSRATQQPQPKTRQHHDFLNAQNSKISANEFKLEILNSTAAMRAATRAWEGGGGGEGASEKKKQRYKSPRETTRDEIFMSNSHCDPSQPTGSSHSQFKSKSKDGLSSKRQWNAANRVSLPRNKAADNEHSSSSHRRKIKHLIDQSRLKKPNQFGQQLEPLPPSTPLEVTLSLASTVEPELAANDTSLYTAVFPESPVENPDLRIKQCDVLVASGIVCYSKLSAPRSSTEYMIRKEMSGVKEKSDSEKIDSSNTTTTTTTATTTAAATTTTKKMTYPMSSLPTMEDIIDSLQTSGPSIPPLCGTAFTSSQQQRATKSKSGGSKQQAPKMARLSPLLSHPDIEKLTKHIGIKVQISHMKQSKAGHIKRSQTIHL